MRKIQEEDEVSLLKHVVCSLMTMSDLFHVTMFNIDIIQKLENSLHLIKNVPLNV
jgi:hypothetical protein